MKRFKAVLFNILLIITAPFALLLTHITPAKAQTTLPSGSYYWLNNNELFIHLDDNDLDKYAVVRIPCDYYDNANPTQYRPQVGLDYGFYSSGGNSYGYCQFENETHGTNYRVASTALEQDYRKNVTSFLLTNQPWTTYPIQYSVEIGTCNQYIVCETNSIPESQNYTSLLPPIPNNNPTGLFTTSNMSAMVGDITSALTNNALPALLVFGSIIGARFVISKVTGG